MFFYHKAKSPVIRFSREMNQVSCLNSILLSKRKARFTKCSETLFSTFLCCCSISKSHRIQPNKRHVLTKQRSTLHYTSLRGRKALYVEERLRILLNPLLQRLSVRGALFQTIPCLFYILKSMGFLAGGIRLSCGLSQPASHLPPTLLQKFSHWTFIPHGLLTYTHPLPTLIRSTGWK